MRARDAAQVWRSVPAGAALLLLLAAGCSAGTGAISGKVSYRGKPLPSGTVTFYGPNGRLEYSPIGPDGSYSIPRAPAGPVTITVVTQPPMTAAAVPQLPKSLLAAAAAPAAAPAPQKYVRIPPQYADRDQSGLQYTVSRGEQTYNIDLK